MKNRRNYYRILQVQPGAPAAIIKASYHTLMQRLKMHPDLGGDHEQAVLINEAFATLSDPVRRAKYDRDLAQRVGQQRAGEAPPQSDDRASGTSVNQAPHAPACEFCKAPVSSAGEFRPDQACVACGSPLCPAQKYQDGDSARRAVERVPRNLPVSFRRATNSREVLSGVTWNLSLNGMGLLSTVALEAGERVSIDCAFCRAVAVVKSAQTKAGRSRGPWLCGVQFLTLHIKQERGGLFSTVA